MFPALRYALVVLAGCNASPDSEPTQSSDASAETSSTAVGSSTSSADTSSTSTSSADSSGGSSQCSALYGRPNENTGLTADQCGPACPCLDGWQAPDYTAADIDALDALQPITFFEPLTEDPYATPEEFPLDATSVCAVVVEGSDDSLQTFANDATAEEAGAQITHDGACGLC